MVALAAQNKGLAVVNTGRNADFQRFGNAHTTQTLALFAGVTDNFALAAALAAGAHALNDPKRGTALGAHLTAAAAVGAGFGAGTLGGTLARTFGTGFQTADLDLFFAAQGCFQKAEGQVVAHVTAADGAVGVTGAGGAAKAAAKTAAEQVTENIAFHSSLIMLAFSFMDDCSSFLRSRAIYIS